MRGGHQRVFLVNLFAVIVALAIGLWVAQPIADTQTASILQMGSHTSPEIMEDATRFPVPRRSYQRIISTSMLTDRILLELIEPRRILSLSQPSSLPIHLAIRAQGKPIVNGLGPVETLIALHPDLVLMSSIGPMGHTRQLRDAGIIVFELGELHGLRTFRSLITLLGDLLSEPNAAKTYLLDFEEKMNQVSLRRGSRPKIPGLYLSVLGGALQGGTLGTSFHDVLESAGVFDVAANQYHGWPTYTSEVLLSLKPIVIVTQEGMGESLCRIEGLKLLPGCQGRGSIVELPEALLNDPGASIVEAADRLSQAIYPPLTQPK